MSFALVVLPLALLAQAPTTTTTATTPAPLALTPLPTDDAVALEDKAFKAIDAERWCLAMRLFEAAHAKGPAAGLLENAIRAAEFAGDTGSALRFADEINAIASAPKATKAQAKKKAQELAKKIAKSGGGVACDSLEDLAPPPPPPPEPPPPPKEEPPPPPPPDNRPYGFVGAGVGGGAVLIGGATAAVGLVPWFAHAAAIEKIEAAERDKGDATSLQAEQEAARAGWESYGQALTVAGVAVSALGLAVVVGGLGYGLFGPDPAEGT